MSQSREQFEARYPIPEGIEWSTEDGRYQPVGGKYVAGLSLRIYEVYVSAWGVWKASREDVVVALPDQFSDAYQEYFDDVEGGCFNGGKYAADVRAAIESAGLRCELRCEVKP
ncbi:hypothetical protein K5D33_07435 [Pseudomonas cichorii]|nr:hypothetical protein [Pseudomonas cichorii]MBX8534556.1 hypothetical protein [Pseudomonas cichorii]